MQRRPVMGKLGVTWVGAISLVLGVACGSGGEADVAAGGNAIQQGDVDQGDPAVGIVFGDERCSGTLIEPDVVLTAAHCLRADQIDFYTGPGKTLTSGKDSSGRPTGMVLHKGKDSAITPGFSPPIPFGENPCPNEGRDLGVVLLAQPIKDIAPLPIARDGHAPDVGTECKVIGYGVHDLAKPTGAASSPTQFGLRRSALETLASVGPRSVDAKGKTGVADDGDSGGPLVCNGVISGVVSCSEDSPHLVDTYGRVDSETKWIECTIQRLRGKLPQDACQQL